jgi:predicted ATP-grasp superfamily ATP-dependent carboligase
VAAPDTTAWLDEGIRDVPHPGEVIRAEHPICTVLAFGSTRTLCRAALDAEAKRIRAVCAPVPGRDSGGDAGDND